MSTMDLDLERDEDRRLELMVLDKLERPSPEPWVERGPRPVMSSDFASLNQREPRVVGWTREHVAVCRADGYASFETRAMVERVWWRIDETPPGEALAQLEHWLAHRCWRTVLTVTRGYQDNTGGWRAGQEVLARYEQAAREGLRQAEEAQDALVLAREEPCVVAADDAAVYVEPSGARYEAMCLAPEGNVSLGWATRRGHKLYEQLVREQHQTSSLLDLNFGWVEPAQLGQQAGGKVALLCRHPSGLGAAQGSAKPTPRGLVTCSLV